jgi:sulfite reductase (NADPH) flavoprotein alpha-component
MGEPGPASEVGAVPSRRALEAAERDARASGAALQGYLTEAAGFIPRQPPSLALPPSHGAWDELAAELPYRFRSVSYRTAARELPLLEGGPGTLPDADVRRSATVLGLLAHAWHRVESSDPGPLPEAIGRPWAQVCARLGRPSPFLEFEDITSANWRFVDPSAPDPLRVENLDLLVPTVGNDAERFFMMTLVELAARATPMVGSVVRAQECMRRMDRRGVEAELLVLVDVVRGLVDALGKADPNPRARTHVDPVVWGTTVAPFAVSINPEMPSPGGTAAALFQVLDAFLGRREYASVLGKEVQRLHDVAPPLVRSFVRGVATMPLGPFLQRADTPSLRGLARALVELYAGEQGLLQLHRIKAYGFLEVAFKIGRPVTLSGFAGVFRDRPWKRVDEALDASMRERAVDGLGTWAQRATLSGRDGTTPAGPDAVRRITLDVAEQGITYQPGDRLAVVPENAPALVAQVFGALRAGPGATIALTSGWRAALALRGVRHPPASIDLVEFLRWAKLRPLPRPVAKALHAISRAPALGQVIEDRLEDQLELWDALVMMTAAGYDVRRLTAARPWQPECLAAIVPPEIERLYSISSAPMSAACQPDLTLTVGDVGFRPRLADADDAILDHAVHTVERHGVASRWLNHHMAPTDDVLPVRVVRPRRFRLPSDPTCAVVMFAGGTGIAPFRGFLQTRAGGPGANILYFSARRLEDVLYREELEVWVRTGVLELHVCLTQDDRQLEADGERGLVVVPGARRWVHNLMERQADRLWALLGDQAPGVAFVCGQAGFAQAVTGGLRAIAAPRSGDGDDGAVHVRRLVAQQRLMMDVFTSTEHIRAPGPLGDRSVPPSELVTRNDDDAGYWMAIDGGVYDVTEFRHLHPGGGHILVESAGTDASAEYRAVRHHLNGEVGAMLSMYKVGLLSRLRLGQRWGIAATPGGFVPVTTAELFRAWVRYTYLIVEMQNAMRNDWTYRHVPLTRGEDRPLTTQKLMLMANTHDRFVVQYRDGSLGEDLIVLWRSTAGLCGSARPIAELSHRLADVRGTARAARAAEVAASLRRLYVISRTPQVASDDRFWRAAAALFDDVRTVEERYLARLKDLMRHGLKLFERHEHEVVALAGSELVDVFPIIPDIVADEQADLIAAWERSAIRAWCS